MTKRTRTRARPKIKPPIVETDQTELDLAELAVLWPRLEAALGRDGAGPSSESERSAGPDPLGSPAVINFDVEQARTRIALDAEQIAGEVERLLKLGRDWRPSAQRAGAASRRLRDAHAANAKARDQHEQTIAHWHAAIAETQVPFEPRLTIAVRRAKRNADDALASRLRARHALTIAQLDQRRASADVARRWTADVLDALPIWYAQLRDRNQPLAEHITADVRDWYQLARTALRLRTAEYRIGWKCPHHRDRPAELVKDADEATLHPAILRGRRETSDLSAPITWRRAESVHCPRCKERWAGLAQLRTLMRMIEAADLVDATAAAEAKAVLTTDEGDTP